MDRNIPPRDRIASNTPEGLRERYLLEREAAVIDLSAYAQKSELEEYAKRSELEDYARKSELVPVGSMTAYAGAAAPQGWLLCDGAAVSRTDYNKLFAVIGTAYGAGNGSSTFNLPDKRGRVSVGKDSSAEFNALGKRGGHKEMQSHTHGAVLYWNGQAGANIIVGSNGAGGGSTGTPSNVIMSAGGGDSGNIQPYQVDNWIIRAK